MTSSKRQICCTRLRCIGEYVWAKFGSVLGAFLAVLVLHLLLMMFCNHLLPNERSLEIRGPFELSNYLIPALVFAVPTIVFAAGVSFAVGELTRRPILLFILPIVALLACGFFLWEWSPNWLDPRINRVLMLIDPSGFRWLNETWLKGDRGVRFYNSARIPFDGGLIASRLVFLALGLGAVVLSQLHLARTVRGAAGPSRSWLDVLRRRRTPAPLELAAAPVLTPSAALEMRSGVPSFCAALGSWHAPSCGNCDRSRGFIFSPRSSCYRPSALRRSPREPLELRFCRLRARWRSAR